MYEIFCLIDITLKLREELNNLYKIKRKAVIPTIHQIMEKFTKPKKKSERIRAIEKRIFINLLKSNIS